MGEIPTPPSTPLPRYLQLRLKSDLLAQLLDLNFRVAGPEETGRPVTAPGVPPSFGVPTPFITEDCINL